jgi:hypothetical protein
VSPSADHRESQAEEEARGSTTSGRGAGAVAGGGQSEYRHVVQGSRGPADGPAWRRVSSPWARGRGALASCAATRRGRIREAGRLHCHRCPAAACYHATGVASPVD